MESLGQQKSPVQYVFGTPIKKPVLRPLRYPLYDTEPLATTLAKVTLFINRSKDNTGASKNEIQTNMPGDGQLATPLEFDLIGFFGYLENGVPIADWNTIYNGGVFRWIFSQSIIWLITKLQMIPQGVGPRGSTTVTATSVLNQGEGTVNNFFNFTDQRRRARKITSNESFKNEIDFPSAGSIDASKKWTSVMLGILYAAL